MPENDEANAAARCAIEGVVAKTKLQGTSGDFSEWALHQQSLARGERTVQKLHGNCKYS